MEKLKPGSAGKNWPPLNNDLRRIALPPNLPIGHPYVVYFIRNGNRVKIGYTKSMRGRLAQFGLTWHQVALMLDGGAQLEGSVHTHFASQRVEGTEWFRLEPPLFAFIKHWRSQPADAALGTAGHVGTCEDVTHISARTGLPVELVRHWAETQQWPTAVNPQPGHPRQYKRSLVDAWLRSNGHGESAAVPA